MDSGKPHIDLYMDNEKISETKSEVKSKVFFDFKFVIVKSIEIRSLTTIQIV